MKALNIYITDEEKRKLGQIQRKYKVSLSTITDKATYWLYYVLVHNGYEGQLNKLLNEYIEKTAARKKTSVKPRCYKDNEYLHTGIKNKSIFSTNALIIYTNKTISNYVDEKGCNKFWAKIDKDLTTAKDTYYNYNTIVRNTARAVKTNKEYYRRLLNE